MLLLVLQLIMILGHLIFIFYDTACFPYPLISAVKSDIDD